MLTTEAEAKTKWCPHTRVNDGPRYPEPVTVNRGPGQGTNCFGSGCMFWRWRIWREKRDRREREDERIGVHQDGLGYCGAAGRPE